MAENKKYNSQTVMMMLKLLLSMRNDLSKEEKESVIRLAEQMINGGKDKDYEDKQIFNIKDYKRRN